MKLLRIWLKGNEDAVEAIVEDAVAVDFKTKFEMMSIDASRYRWTFPDEDGITVVDMAEIAAFSVMDALRDVKVTGFRKDDDE